MPQRAKQSSMEQLQARVPCPHCWYTFPPEEVLWISAHPHLLGDSLLGADAQQRFLATRFTVEGHAIDVKGATCTRLACPKCHLSISRAMLEMKPLFVSILGAPSSGKSCFLAAMSSQLRNCLPERFSLSFQDADPVANKVLRDYEDTLSNSTQKDQLAALPKTEKEGELYESVRYEEREVWYPRPFIFSIKPTETHPSYAKRGLLSRALCVYDNAGEHFLHGGESPSSPNSQHLASSHVLLFMFDPTQHVMFRKACQGKSNDPQMGTLGWHHRQDQILLEAANRIHNVSGLGQGDKYWRPLVVVVTKFDAWCGLTGADHLSTSSVVRSVGPSLSAIDRDGLEKISGQVRSMLTKLAPEVVAAAEGFCGQVTYIPVSALGQGPEVDQKTGLLGIRPKDIKPMWAEIPMLYAIDCVAEDLMPSERRAGSEVVEVAGKGSSATAADSAPSGSTTSAPPTRPAPAGGQPCQEGESPKYANERPKQKSAKPKRPPEDAPLYPRLIDNIQEVLSSELDVDTGALTALNTQLTEAIREVNERLGECDALLRRGLRSEAICRSENWPDLLEAVTILDFSELDYWNELVVQYGLPNPPAIAIDIAADLNEAYAAEQPLAHLMREHRLRALATAPLESRISTMRKLSRLDGDNPMWKDDIRAFEKRRLKQLEGEVDEAMRRKDARALGTLEEEVCSEEWLERPSTRLVKKTVEAAEGERPLPNAARPESTLRDSSTVFPVLAILLIVLASLWWFAFRDNDPAQPPTSEPEGPSVEKPISYSPAFRQNQPAMQMPPPESLKGISRTVGALAG